VQRTPSGLSIQYVVCEASQKLPQLVAFLQASSLFLLAGGVPAGKLLFFWQCQKQRKNLGRGM
jgi:hypothetical protein